MKLQIIGVLCAVLGALQGSVVAQNWSSWNAAPSSWFMLGHSAKDVQYRWWASTPSEGEVCHVQLQDGGSQSNQIVISVLIDYQYHDAQSTRDVVTITDTQGERYGEVIVHQCVSVGALRVTDIARR
jgi:hypothetical protein